MLEMTFHRFFLFVCFTFYFLNFFFFLFFPKPLVIQQTVTFFVHFALLLTSASVGNLLFAYIWLGYMLIDSACERKRLQIAIYLYTLVLKSADEEWKVMAYTAN